MPLSQITYESRLLPVTFDLAAVHTIFNPHLAALFPALIKTGKSENHSLNGVSGTTIQRSIWLADFEFQFGRQVRLAPVTILLDQTTCESAWTAANLGFDSIQQGRPFVLNFRKMSLEFPSPPKSN